MSEINASLINIYHYRGDKFANNFNDIISKNATSNLTPVSDTTTVYALPIDKIVVTTPVSGTNYLNTTVMWDFGDGTISTDISAIHWYKYPGKYAITLTRYTKDKPHTSVTIQTDVNVYNYTPKKFDTYISITNTYGDIIAIEPLNLYNNQLYLLDNNVFNFNIHKFNSWQSYNVLSSIGYNITLYSEGHNTPPIDTTQYNSNAFSHLSTYSAFIVDNKIANNVHFDAINTEVYVTYNSNTGKFEECESLTEGSVLAGTYDYKHVQFIDDLAENNKVQIAAIFDTTGFKLADNIESTQLNALYNYVPYYYSYTNNMSTSAFNNSDISKLIPSYGSPIISSYGLLNTCGLSGSQFDIFEHKIIKQPINFVYRSMYGYNTSGEYSNHFKSPEYKFLKNTHNYIISAINKWYHWENHPDHNFGDIAHDTIGPDNKQFKTYEELEPYITRTWAEKYEIYRKNDTKTGAIAEIALYHDNGDYENDTPVLSSSYMFYNDDIMADPSNDIGGYLKGNLVANDILSSVFIQIIPKEEHLDKINKIQSNVFSIDELNSSTHISLFKQNENFNLAEKYKSLALQPRLQESENLFNDFIGQIVGDDKSQMNLGVRIYEKIANFVDNTQNIDTCNITYLYDIYNKFDEFIAEYNLNWPEEMQRLIDLLSIQFNKLRGFNNLYTSDFDKRGYINNKNYGKNLGKQLDFNTALIPYLNDTFIIAYEKFSEKYIKLNCNIDYSVVSSDLIYNEVDNISSFPLSAYNYETWGWNLVLPTTIDTTNTVPIYVKKLDAKIEDYYIFYEFINTPSNEILQSVIDFYNPNTTSFDRNMTTTQWETFKKLYIMQTILKHIQQPVIHTPVEIIDYSINIDTHPKDIKVVIDTNNII